MLAVIDYGMGNLHSVSKALAHVAPRTRIEVTSDPAVIRSADRVILPGVGAIRDCMGEICRLGFDSVVRDYLSSGRPLLGICVGMQVLLEYSEENGGVQGLGLVPGVVRRFQQAASAEETARLKVPQMGWNQVWQPRPHPLWEGIPDGERFYFVHSYHATKVPAEWVSGESVYGSRYPSALGRGNVFAVQFHPEKSQHAGLQLLDNFANWDGRV